MAAHSEIGPAGAEDWPAVGQLLGEYAAWITGAAGIDPYAVQPVFHREVTTPEACFIPPGSRMLVARLDGAPVGITAVVMAAARMAELRRVYVQPEARGHRFGERLLQSALSEAERLGADTIRLETMPAVMQHAYRMYEAYGFRHVSGFEDVHVDGMVYMQRPLELPAAAR